MAVIFQQAELYYVIKWPFSGLTNYFENSKAGEGLILTEYLIAEKRFIVPVLRIELYQRMRGLHLIADKEQINFNIQSQKVSRTN